MELSIWFTTELFSRPLVLHTEPVPILPRAPPSLRMENLTTAKIRTSAKFKTIGPFLPSLKTWEQLAQPPLPLSLWLVMLEILLRLT